MPARLLPATAAAFAARTAPSIVLAAKAEPWLIRTFKRTNILKRPFGSVYQHQRYLAEALGGDSALWNLCSIMLPRALSVESSKAADYSTGAMSDHQLLHIEAYVVYVDMASQNEAVFKLTQGTIDSLIKYHKEFYRVNTATFVWSRNEKELQIEKSQEEYIQAINRFVFRTHAQALEGLEEGGAGELLDGQCEQAKNALMALFHPLPPHTLSVIDAVRPAPVPTNCMQGRNELHRQHMLAASSLTSLNAGPASALVISPTMTACSDHSIPMSLEPCPFAPPSQLPSPAPSFSELGQPYRTFDGINDQFYSRVDGSVGPAQASSADTFAPLIPIYRSGIDFSDHYGASSWLEGLW